MYFTRSILLFSYSNLLHCIFHFLVEELENELIDDRVSLSERVAALNVPLKCTGVSSEVAADELELDQFPMVQY